MSSDVVVCVSGLVRRFESCEVVRGISLRIAGGESVALLGPSGSGKTTLLHMMGLLDRPTSGEVLIEGTSAWAEGDRVRARLRLRTIGFVFQQNNLLPDLSAEENVALPAWRAQGARRLAERQASALLERFGLERTRSSKAAQLSVGEAQRVAIARALVNQPKLILADEPTGSLDSENRDRVLDALLDACQGKAALLVVTHDREVASRMKRVLEMRDGRLVGET